MTNWCHNYMKITGSIDEIARFKRTCIRVVSEGKQAELDFNAVTPMPYFPADDDGKAWYDWACKHWGTTRNAHYFVTRDEPDSYECGFDTASSPPVPIWEKLGEMFPTLEFSLSGSEPLADFGFKGTIRDGKLDLREVPLIWKAIDPKTGKTISGTCVEVDAALDAALGRGGGCVSASIGETEW